MDTWLIVVISLLISLSLSTLLKSLFFSSSSTAKKLPPGPPTAPVIGNYLWLRKSFWDLEPLLRKLRLKHGPLISLWLGPRLIIFVGSHSVTHRALIQNGAVFSDRPKLLAGSGRPSISASAYGPTWRLLRRNLTSEILHPARVKSFSHARRWVLNILIRRLRESGACEGKSITLVDHLQYAMFSLLVLMCFGDKLEEKQIKGIETIQRNLLLNIRRFNVLNMFPRLGKILFRNRWKELMQMRENQEKVLIPLIKARIEIVKQRKQRQKSEDEGGVISYVDSLLDLELPEKKRKLKDDEIVSLCGEFLDAGTDTTATALQWIMANLVKYPQIQSRLHEEIKGIMGHKRANEEVDIIEEEDLQRMGYLKAVVLEGLRRHPPAHFVVPHAVTEDVELEGYLLPKNTSVNFMVAEMGWDPNVWEDPMEFRPERFTCGGNGGNGGCDGGEEEEAVFDITGSKEIKMMPFGVGRRICPGANLAMLHLELFVANLVWYFEWTAADGDGVDLTEKQEFTIVMKNPLRVRISPRA